MKTQIDLGWLFSYVKPRINDDRLHLWSEVERAAGGRISGIETVDIGEAFCALIKKFEERYPVELAQAETNQASKEAAEKTQLEALNRFKHYATHGLTDGRKLHLTESNFNKLRDWIVVNGYNYFSSEQIDRAVQAIHQELDWITPPPPPPPVRLLENGEPELPLTASESEMRRASKAQLLDLQQRVFDARQREIRDHNNEVMKQYQAGQPKELTV